MKRKISKKDLQVVDRKYGDQTAFSMKIELKNSKYFFEFDRHRGEDNFFHNYLQMFKKLDNGMKKQFPMSLVMFLENYDENTCISGIGEMVDEDVILENCIDEYNRYILGIDCDGMKIN